MSGLNDLQSKLIKDLKHKDTKIDTHEGVEILKRDLSLCEALIILDDVDHISQLDAFLPIKDVISPTSLILVTSRDKHVLKSSGVLESSIYNLEGLNTLQSKELFCSYAFDQPLPQPEDFEDLVDEFVTGCKGLPLALKVIGALLCGQNDKRYWQDQLKRLNETLADEIFTTLKISYDSLVKQDQPIFLDIACFFLGEDIEQGIRIWGMAGLTNLRNKCLLEVDTENRIKMHDHIRDMGRSIAEEPTIPPMPRRFWDSTTNMIDDLLVQPSTVITDVRGINMVRSSQPRWLHDKMRWLHGEMTCFPTKRRDPNISPSKHLFNNSHFPGMRNLRLLVTEEDQFDDMLSRVQPPHLIWLRWYRISHSSLPNWIPMKNLRVLEVEGTRLNLLWPYQSQGAPLELRELHIWAPLSEIPKSIGQLKYLERIAIYNSEPLAELERLPDEFCRLGSLKYLILKGFSNMVSLPDSFGELTNLQHIDLEIGSLETLPDSFGKLTRLKHLNLWGCESLTISSGTLGDITTLEYLDISSCELNELPPQVADQLSLQELYLRVMKLNAFPSVCCNLKVLQLSGDFLEMLPPGLGDLKCLKRLSIVDSPQLKSLPDSIGLLPQLTKLKIWYCGIERLPRSLLQMNMLESLEVVDCPVQEHPFQKEVEGERETEGETGSNNKLYSSNGRCMFGLKTLDLSYTKMREIYFDEDACPNLEALRLFHCSELRQIGGCLPKLTAINIGECGLETLTLLENLSISGCEKLQSISCLGQLTTLQVDSCPDIQVPSGVGHLTSLERLYVWECGKLQSIPLLGQLTTLRYLYVGRCPEIQALSGLGHLTSLDVLSISGLGKLKSIPELRQLRKLRKLWISRCCELQELSGVEYLMSLEINVRDCPQLKSCPVWNI